MDIFLTVIVIVFNKYWQNNSNEEDKFSRNSFQNLQFFCVQFLNNIFNLLINNCSFFPYNRIIVLSVVIICQLIVSILLQLFPLLLIKIFFLVQISEVCVQV